MKSILVIGLGRFGRHMTKKFIEEGNSVHLQKNKHLQHHRWRKFKLDNGVNIL